MKTLIGNARNHCLVACKSDDGESFTQPYTEVVLIVSEPNFQCDQAGAFVKVAVTSTCRLMMSPGGLRDLALSLSEYANEAEAFQNELGTSDPDVEAPEPNGH